jgi:hypothetical protein
MPRYIWDKKKHEYPPEMRADVRAQMLMDAVFRYRADGFEPLPEWSTEWAEIVTDGLKDPGH